MGPLPDIQGGTFFAESDFKTKPGVVVGLTAPVSAPIANEPEEGVWIAKVIDRGQSA
jgi:hypothetical protein